MAGLKRKRAGWEVSAYIHGQRRYLRLGSVYNRRTAEDVRQLVERLIEAEANGCQLDRRAQATLDTVSDDVRDKLVAIGLLDSQRRHTVAELWQAYYDDAERQYKPCTLSAKRQARRRLLDFCSVRDVQYSDQLTRRHALDFVRYLDRQVAEATRAGTIRDCRRLYNWAVEQGLADDNPFTAIPRGSFANKRREYYVSPADYQAMIDAAPNAMWRAVIALYRIGGLRKNEALLVTWQDVDFERGRLLVHSTKTERYKGHETRVCPLFPELRRRLWDWWEQQEPNDSPYVVSCNRTTVSKWLERIVFYAGLNRWDRLIQNLRSSRANDVYRDFGPIAESEWLGHSTETAREHYLHLLDTDFARALALDDGATEMGPSDGAGPHKDPHTGGNSAQFGAIGATFGAPQKNARPIK